MPPETVGILAGNGVYPRLLVERLRNRGIRVVIAGIQGQTEDGVGEAADVFEAFPLGAIRRTAAFFRDSGVHSVFFAGGVTRPVPWRLVCLDRVSLRLLVKSLTAGDDALLRGVADAFETLGIIVGDPQPYLKDLFAEAGPLAGPSVGAATVADMRVAWRAARDLGLKDRGQAAIALRGRVVGLEGKGGTDALIAGISEPGAVMAKVVKPEQDGRFDLPAIGPSTVTHAHRAGLLAIGIQAEGVLLLERNRIVEASDRYGIALVGFPSDGPVTGGEYSLNERRDTDTTCS